MWNIRKVSWLVLLVLLSGMVLTLPTTAQGDDIPNTSDEDIYILEVTGPITELSDTSLTVQGITFDIATADIDGDLAVDVVVDVEATAEDDLYIAVDVDVVRDDDSDDDDRETIEVTGPITELSDTRLTVQGITFDITTAEINIELDLDVLVFVEGLFEDDMYVALEIYAAAADDDRDDESPSDDRDDDPRVGDVAISEADAIAIVLEIFPNTSIIEIYLDDDEDDNPYWDIETSHGHDIEIDAMTGDIIRLDRDDHEDDREDVREDARSENRDDHDERDDDEDDERNDDEDDERNDDDDEDNYEDDENDDDADDEDDDEDDEEDDD